MKELKGQRKETVRPDQSPRTQLIDALIESYGRDNKNGGPDVDRRFFHFAKLGVILGLVRRDQFATKQ